MAKILSALNGHSMVTIYPTVKIMFKLAVHTLGQSPSLVYQILPKAKGLFTTQSNLYDRAFCECK